MAATPPRGRIIHCHQLTLCKFGLLRQTQEGAVGCLPFATGSCLYRFHARQRRAGEQNCDWPEQSRYRRAWRAATAPPAGVALLHE